jgi:hypothetical protein
MNALAAVDEIEQFKADTQLSKKYTDGGLQRKSSNSRPASWGRGLSGCVRWLRHRNSKQLRGARS